MTGTNSHRHSSTRNSAHSSTHNSTHSGSDDDDMKIRNSDLSSVGHKVRMLTLLQQEADRDAETNHSHTESSNDTRSTNATAADDTFQKHDSLCLHPPLETSVLDPVNDNGLILRTTSSTTSSSSSSSRPMSFVSSISSASASGVTQITPEDYPDYQISAKHKPDKEPLWREERYLATAVSEDNDNPTKDDTDAWKLIHDMLRGEAKDLVSCAQALLRRQQTPTPATKQLNESTKKEEPNDDNQDNTHSVSASVPAPAVEPNDSQDNNDNTQSVAASTAAPTPPASPPSPVQQWQVEALQSILEAHTQNLRHYHQLYHGVLLPALVQRFRVPKANEHDIEHRELLRRLKSAHAEILDPLLEMVTDQDHNETEVNKSASGKSDAKNRSASSNPAASCVAGASTVSLLSRLLAQLQAYKARLERHLYGQEETTLILMQAFFTPRQMQRLRLTRIWLAPSFASHTLFWGSLVHRVGLARFRLRFLEQERVPKALWYWSFKPAWKAYVTEILKPTQALKAGVLRLPEGAKTSSKKSSSKTASTSSSPATSALLSSTGTSVPAKDEATATDGAPASSNKSSGVLLRSWKHSSGSSSSSKRARVNRASVKVLRSWKRNSSKKEATAQVVQC